MNKNKRAEIGITILLIAVCLVVIFSTVYFLVNKVWHNPGYSEYKIYKEECENKTREIINGQTQVVKDMNITKTFSLAGLEITNIGYIYGYSFKDEQEYGVCWENHGYSSGQWCGRDTLLRALSGDDRYRDYLGSSYINVASWSVTGNGVRVYGRDITNLKYDQNDIIVNFDIQEIAFIKESITEQKCERKEVEEITFEDCSNVPLCKDVGENYSGWCFSDNACQEISISKKDITKEWLEENYECSKPVCSGKYSKNVQEVEVTQEEYDKYHFNYYIYDGKLVCGASYSSNGEKYTLTLENNPGCSEYKYNNYFVEVIK